MQFREVDVIVSNELTGEYYEARSYPNMDYDGNGLVEFYKVPVYFVYVDGVGSDGKAVRHTWRAPRFMPFYNDPHHPEPHYKTTGFRNSGLVYVPRQKAPAYLPHYEVHNSHSDYGGAIQIRGNFLIHAGPESLEHSGWGAAGCVEIVGDFDEFKGDILDLAGWKGDVEHQNDALVTLVGAKKLFVRVERARPPMLINNVTRQLRYDPTTHGFVNP